MLLELYVKMMNMLRREEGQDLSEYAILIGLIAILLIVAVTALGGGIETIFENITTELKEAAIPG